MAVLASAFFGLVALRVSAIYFLLITLAIGQLVWALVFAPPEGMRWLTGGGDGLAGIPYPDLGFLQLSPGNYYYFVLVVFVICALLLYRLVKSPFGYCLQGIRESDIRMRALGYNVWLYRYIAFIIAGLFAGVAGVMWVHFNGIITPEAVGVGASGLLWTMLIIGGIGTLWGGLIGSAMIWALQYIVSGFTPERWPLILGVCFVAVIMFYRRGTMPQLTNLWEKVSGYGSAKG